MPEYYNSPRWSAELPDCSMPMTFDTYSRCSADCLYCQPLDALVMLADGSWKPVGDIEVGEHLVGLMRQGHSWYGVENEVLEIFRRHAPLLDVETRSGKVVRCTPDHHWLVRSESGIGYHPVASGMALQSIAEVVKSQTPSNEYRWGYLHGVAECDGSFVDKAYNYSGRSSHVVSFRLYAKNPFLFSRFQLYAGNLDIALNSFARSGTHPAGVRIAQRAVVDLLKTREHCDDAEYWRGWLAGVFDAVGCWSRQGQVAFALDAGEDTVTYGRVVEALRSFGFNDLIEAWKGISLQSGVASAAKLFAHCDPADSRKRSFIGRERVTEWDEICDIRSLPGEHEVVSFKTTTGNYVGQGFHSRNCFSVNQRDVGVAKSNFSTRNIRPVDIGAVKKIFTGGDSQFANYVKARRPMQWGGLSDQFDLYERKYGVTLELLKFFREIEYPLCFSTKFAWWTEDERYTSLFEGMPWNVKFSIISNNEEMVRAVERGCPSTAERFEGMARASQFVEGGVTLRLRPFVPGMTDPPVEDGTPGCVRLIERAATAGATAMSTEFFCLEQRSPSGKKWRYPLLSKTIGFDIVQFYRERSTASGYLRLNRDYKRPIINRMQAVCEGHDMRFYVSDAHFKERCHNGSCCGLDESWNYSRGQICEALVRARERWETTGVGRVTWQDIAPDLKEIVGHVVYQRASGYNTNSSEGRAKFFDLTLYDEMRHDWNHPNTPASPYRQHGGILKPVGLDENGDVIYEYDPSKS